MGLPFEPSEDLLREILSPSDQLIMVRTSPKRALFDYLRALITAPGKCRTYTVMPSLERPVFIVPCSGRPSRAFFRSEAAAPYNSRRNYIFKWLLASLGVSPFLQRGFVIVCRHD